MTSTPVTAVPRLGAVVLHYGSANDTARCLRALRAARYPGLDVLLVDNGAEEFGALELTPAERGGARLVTAPTNLGFAEGANVGVRDLLLRGCDYIVLCNNDAEVAPDALARLVARAQAEPSIGLVSPKILELERPDVLWFAGAVYDRRSARAPHRGLGQRDTGQWDAGGPTDRLTGCVLLVSRAAIDRVGLLDPRFFLYYEDVEWSLRMRRAGLVAWYEPAARAWHRSGPRSPDGWAYYDTRNRLLTLERHAGRAGRRRARVEAARTATKALARWVATPARRPEMRARLSGVGDFLLGRFGPRPPRA